MTRLDDLVAERLAEGWHVVQQGSVHTQPAHGLTCADRFDSFDARSVLSGDCLLDDETRWVHLKRAAQ